MSALLYHIHPFLTSPNFQDKTQKNGYTSVDKDMNKQYISFLALGLLLSVSGARLSAQTTPTVSVPITVTDVTGYARVNSPVTSGVPIPLSAVGSQWSLYDGVSEVPLQTTVLHGEQTPWLLLDFPATVNPNATKQYTLQNTPPTNGATPITYQHTASTETVTTGPLQFTVATSPFQGIQSLAYDANANGTFEVNERIVTGGNADALRIENAETNVLTAADTTPTAVVWEQQGDVRGTLRIDGAFHEGPTELLTYSLRITAWAGRTDLGFELLLKNSKQSASRLVKLSSAIFQIGANATEIRATRTGDRIWGHSASNGLSIQWLPTTEVVTTSYTPGSNRTTSTFSVDSNGGLVLGDLSYQGGQATVDFNTSSSVLEQSIASISAVTPLFARADASWYSQQGALGVPNFGTLEDELAAYAGWNWAHPNPNNAFAAIPHINRPTNFYPSWSTVNGAEDLEGDFLQENNWMFLRLGDQGYKDRMDRVAQYEKWQWLYRTDGFSAYSNDYWDGPHIVSRGSDTLSNSTITDQQRINYDIQYGRLDYSHAWASGLVDYYYLTGDHDSLEAAIDMAEECRNQSDWLIPGGNGNIGDSPRSKARCWNNTIRVWEATGDAQWATAINHYRNLFMQSTLYSPDLMYHSPTCNVGTYQCTTYPNGTFTSPFQVGDLVHAMYLDWNLFQVSAVRTRLIEIANFAQNYGFDPATGATGDYIIRVGSTTYHHSYSVFRNYASKVQESFAGSSLSFIDALTIGYRLTGSKSYLSTAKNLYSAGTKRLGANPYSQRIADDAHVGMFAGYLFGNPNYFFNFDFSSIPLFLKDAQLVDDIAPGQVQNLR